MIKSTQNSISTHALLRKWLIWRWHQDRRCCYCGRNTTIKARNKAPIDRDATVEHIFPKTDLRRFLLNRKDLNWLTLSCYKCNLKKGKEASERFYKYSFPVEIIDIKTLLNPQEN